MWARDGTDPLLSHVGALEGRARPYYRSTGELSKSLRKTQGREVALPALHLSNLLSLEVNLGDLMNPSR